MSSYFCEDATFTSDDLLDANLKLTDNQAILLRSPFYPSMDLKRLMAATFVNDDLRTAADFSEAYGPNAWRGFASSYYDFVASGLRPRLNAALAERYASSLSGRSLTVSNVRTDPQAWPIWDRGVTSDETANITESGLTYDATVPPQGGFWYPAPDTTVASLRTLITNLVAGLAGPTPVQAAADFCRYLTALHPFKDGNGRAARFILNAALIEAGYAPAILVNPDDDYLLSPAAWRQEVVKGIARSKKYLATLDDKGNKIVA